MGACTGCDWSPDSPTAVRNASGCVKPSAPSNYTGLEPRLLELLYEPGCFCKEDFGGPGYKRPGPTPGTCAPVSHSNFSGITNLLGCFFGKEVFDCSTPDECRCCTWADFFPDGAFPPFCKTCPDTDGTPVENPENCVTPVEFLSRLIEIINSLDKVCCCDSDSNSDSTSDGGGGGGGGSSSDDGGGGGGDNSSSSSSRDSSDGGGGGGDSSSSSESSDIDYSRSSSSSSEGDGVSQSSSHSSDDTVSSASGSGSGGGGGGSSTSGSSSHTPWSSDSSSSSSSILSSSDGGMGAPDRFVDEKTLAETGWWVDFRLEDITAGLADKDLPDLNIKLITDDNTLIGKLTPSSVLKLTKVSALLDDVTATGVWRNDLNGFTVEVVTFMSRLGKAGLTITVETSGVDGKTVYQNKINIASGLLLKPTGTFLVFSEIAEVENEQQPLVIQLE